MNIYKKHLEALSDKELMQAVRELKTFDEQGILEVGVLRRVLEALEKEGEAADTAFGVCRYGLLQRAAYKWAGV